MIFQDEGRDASLAGSDVLRYKLLRGKMAWMPVIILRYYLFQPKFISGKDRYKLLRGKMVWMAVIILRYCLFQPKFISGKDFKDLAWDNYILRMKGQEPVRSLFNVATIEYIICAEDFMLSSGDFHNEWYLDRLLGKVKLG